MEQNCKIENITKNSTNLEVDWSDGKKSKFNYLWLRDNCPTAHDKDSRHRMFNILKVSKDINPKKFSVNDDGKCPNSGPFRRSENTAVNTTDNSDKNK